MRHHVDLQNVDVSIWVLGKINLMADRIAWGIDFVPHFGDTQSFGICSLVYLTLVPLFHSQGIGFRDSLYANMSEYENAFGCVKRMQGILQAAQCSVIMRFISSVHVEFQQGPCALNCISKMYFSLWMTPGVSERMWSVNIEVSISGEYQTLGRNSGRLSD
jgi:hypothetical protein